jgi:quinoprotein glucose dehydrogenase
MRITPWGGVVGRFWNPENKIPCSAPPFGELVAVDLSTGDIAWHVPFGYVAELRAKGITGVGALNIGGPMLTASGVTFIGATTDRYFRAFDTRTGRQLWETELEASAHSVPMTFMGRDGRQYVVVAAGGGSFLNSPPGTKIVAFALPGGKPAISSSISSMPAPGAAADDLPPGPGRESVITMCSGCHGLKTVVASRRTKAEWQSVVASMAALGAPGSADDVSRTAQYLALRLGRVDVNAATEAELREIGDLTAAEAAAILDFRAHDGQIRSLGDLKNVPGLDAARVEARKDRFLFDVR